MVPFDPDQSTWSSPWDAMVRDQSGIDQWCSQSPWQQGVHRAFGDDSSIGDPLGLQNADGMALFGRMTTDEGAHALVPFDRVWGFATPIVAHRNCESNFLRSFSDYLLADESWKLCVLTGFAKGSVLDEAVIENFGRHLSLYRGEERARCIASLDGGADHYLARRSREHRRNIRQAITRAEHEAVSFAVIETYAPTEVAARLHAIEQKSWKGLEESGIESPEMAKLYESLITTLHATGALRCVVATHRDEDVGFILGGVLNGTYRGLQISFVESARALSVGNLLQWHEIQRACAESLHTYDLGMDIEYKRRWAEGLFTTQSIIAVRQ